MRLFSAAAVNKAIRLGVSRGLGLGRRLGMGLGLGPGLGPGLGRGLGRGLRLGLGMGLGLGLVAPLPVRADEGMWLLNQPPRERLERDYGFRISQDWLDHQMRSSVRFNNGGSGSFVSSQGLVITNHHIGADALQKLSKPGQDLVQTGYYAATRDRELKCPDLELNCLQAIFDVTSHIEAAVHPGMTVQQASAARRAAMSGLEKQEADRTGLRADVVTLYQGGAYHLYLYKKYTDVRLVMAPEAGIAFFGGDADNFEYPRHDFDVCFFRVYENNQPLKPTDYLAWNPQGAKEGDLVFVVGHPGRTNRLDTYGRLKHLRDVTLPYRLNSLRQQEAVLRQYSQKGLEQSRQAQEDLYGVANSRKAFFGQYYGLLDAGLMQKKREKEQRLLQKAPHAKAAVETVDNSQNNLTQFEKEYWLLEQRNATQSRLFEIARHLVRMAEELPKPNEQRMREYRESNLESLEFELFSAAPIAVDLEKARLSASMAFAGEILGGEHPVTAKLLAGMSPEARANQLIGGTSLLSVDARRALARGGRQAIVASPDPLIQLARSLEPETRAVRNRYDLEVDEPERQAYAQIARAQFEVEGTNVAPDATFTLRLAYGKVLGYVDNGRRVPFATTFATLYRSAKEHGYREPFQLPVRWVQGQSKLKLDTPFNFVSTADTIGGNSGSPVVNRDGELVGVNFDRNRFGLVRNFVYTDEQARHVAVASPAILEALTKLYNCHALVAELGK